MNIIYFNIFIMVKSIIEEIKSLAGLYQIYFLHELPFCKKVMIKIANE